MLYITQMASRNNIMEVDKISSEIRANDIRACIRICISERRKGDGIDSGINIKRPCNDIN